jgi:hypothetical protein
MPDSHSCTQYTMDMHHPLSPTLGKHKHNATDLNLRNATDIYVPFPRIDLFIRMPLYALPHTWNSHDIVRYYANRTTFRYALQELHSEAEQAAE